MGTIVKLVWHMCHLLFQKKMRICTGADDGTDEPGFVWNRFDPVALKSACNELESSN
jgi:hypothetical protein